MTSRLSKDRLTRHTLSVEEVLKMDLRPPVSLLSPWLSRGSIVLLHAQPKTGKTYFALAAAIAVSNGAPLMGWSPGKPGRARKVLYLDAEMPLWLFNKRIKQLRHDQDVSGITLLSREQLLKAGLEMPDLAERPGQDALDGLIEHHDPDLVVLDSLSALTRSGVENERESWLPIEGWLQRQRARSRAVLLVHHQGKSGLQRGTSAREEVVDASLAMRRDDDDVLRITIERLRDHDGLYEASFRARLEFEDGCASWRKLSRRADELHPTKQRVLELAKEGKTNAEIAKIIDIDRKTVSGHRKALERAGWFKQDAGTKLAIA